MLKTAITLFSAIYLAYAQTPLQFYFVPFQFNGSMTTTPNNVITYVPSSTAVGTLGGIVAGLSNLATNVNSTYANASVNLYQPIGPITIPPPFLPPPEFVHEIVISYNTTQVNNFQFEDITLFSSGTVSFGWNILFSAYVHQLIAQQRTGTITWHVNPECKADTVNNTAYLYCNIHYMFVNPIVANQSTPMIQAIGKSAMQTAINSLIFQTPVPVVSFSGIDNGDAGDGMDIPDSRLQNIFANVPLGAHLPPWLTSTMNNIMSRIPEPSDDKRIPPNFTVPNPAGAQFQVILNDNCAGMNLTALSYMFDLGVSYLTNTTSYSVFSCVPARRRLLQSGSLTVQNTMDSSSTLSTATFTQSLNSSLTAMSYNTTMSSITVSSASVSSKKLSTGAIVGIAVGGSAGLATVVGGATWHIIKRRKMSANSLPLPM